MSALVVVDGLGVGAVVQAAVGEDGEQTERAQEPDLWHGPSMLGARRPARGRMTRQRWREPTREPAENAAAPPER